MIDEHKKLEGVLNILKESIHPEEINIFINTKEKDLIQYHFDFGRYVRNTFGLWSGNPELLKDMNLSSQTHPHEVSQLIIEALHKKLNKGN